ncbi:histamine H2 receptor isoform X1 [Nilaparvata lugens]|uniref:histamine H2 receptor isoform X1 n=1 Tax=Nilaparvata lugens TaxID=108931 RepID=UPI00193E0D8B|nr:histamine H2 receptor isoform X1 [Nilaparvata lugens]
MLFDLEPNSTSTVTTACDTVTVQSALLLWVTLHGVLLVLIACGNVVTLYVLCSSLQLSQQPVSNRFVISLALSDSLIGVALLGHMAFDLAPELAGSRVACLLRLVLTLLACSASVINVIAIAVDRYYAILHPFKYETAMTNRRAHLLLAAGWLLALLISSTPLYWSTIPLPPPHLILAPAFTLSWAAMFGIYWRIWREALHQAYKLRRTNVNELRRSCLQVVLTIMATFTLTWLPLVLAISLASPALYRSTLCLACAGSSLNPYVYAWNNAQFRHTFGHMLRCRTASQSLHHERSSVAVSLCGDRKSSIIESTKMVSSNRKSSLLESKVSLYSNRKSSVDLPNIASLNIERKLSRVESKMSIYSNRKSSVDSPNIASLNNESELSRVESNMSIYINRKSFVESQNIALLKTERELCHIDSNMSIYSNRKSSVDSPSIPSLNNEHKLSSVESKMSIYSNRKSSVDSPSIPSLNNGRESSLLESKVPLYHCNQESSVVESQNIALLNNERKLSSVESNMSIYRNRKSSIV